MLNYFYQLFLICCYMKKTFFCHKLAILFFCPSLVLHSLSLSQVVFATGVPIYQSDKHYFLLDKKEKSSKGSIFLSCLSQLLGYLHNTNIYIYLCMYIYAYSLLLQVSNSWNTITRLLDIGLPCYKYTISLISIKICSTSLWTSC